MLFKFFKGSEGKEQIGTMAIIYFNDCNMYLNVDNNVAEQIDL